MKKLVLGLLATIMFGFAGYAQGKSAENAKSAIDGQMITLVHVTNAVVYQKGMSQSEFMKLAGPAKPTKDETVLLQKLYKYASEGISDSEILKQDNSVLVSVTQSGNISETPSANKFPWKLLLEIAGEIIKVILPYITP